MDTESHLRIGEKTLSSAKKRSQNALRPTDIPRISKMQILRPLLDWIHTSMGKTLKCPSIAESTQKMALVSGSLSIPKIDPPKSALDTEVDLPRYATHQKVYWILR